MQIFNDGLSEPLYKAILRSQAAYKRTGWLSTTSCMKPVRAVQLERRHDSIISVPASFFLDSFIGTAIHNAIDGSMGEGHHEREFVIEVCGITFSGRPDICSGGEIGDFKGTKASSFVFSGGLKEEWKWQGNINAYLAKANGEKIHSIWVELIFLDYNKWEALRNADYPKSRVVCVPVELLPEEEVRRFIEERVELHLAADSIPDAELPLCTPEEMWAKADSFAVMKPGAKRASKLFDNEKDAKKEARVLGAEVVKRPGERIRCANYCAAAQVCNQWKDYCTEMQDK